MEGAPFCTILDLREQEFVLSLNLPPLQALFLLLVLQTNDVIIPADGAPSVSANPAPIQVHVDIDIDIAMDINGHVRSRNRLAQG